MPGNREVYWQTIVLTSYSMPRERGPALTKPLGPFTEMWTRMSAQLTRNFIEANRAAAAAFGLTAGRDSEPTSMAGRAPAVETTVDGVAYRVPDWKFEGSADTFEDLSVGDHVTFSKEISDADVRSFARVSGDTNRLHLDEAYADESRFDGRIVHGSLVAGVISAALARLPQTTVYLSQDLTFRQPVGIGERLTADCEVVENLGGGRYRLTTTVTNAEGDVVVDGEAEVLVEDVTADD